LAAYNAAVNYEKSAKPMAAVSMYNMALAKKDVSVNVRRNSKEALGNLYQSMGDYSKAAGSYEQFFKEFPKDPLALDLLLNAAILRDGLSEYNSAIENYDKYYRAKKGSDRAVAIFAIAEIWKRRGNSKMAQANFEQYIKSNPSDLEKIVRAHFEVARILEAKGAIAQADQWYRTTIALHEKFSRQKSGVGLRYASQSNFTLAYRGMNGLRKIKIGDGAQAASALKKAANIIDQMNKGMASVVRMDDGPYVVAALVALGEANDYMVQTIRAAPIPAQIRDKPAESAEYKKTIEEQLVRPFAEAATKNYETALSKANDLSVFSQWTKMAASRLSQLRPEKFLPTKEYTYEVRRVDWMAL
jgi:tetratricopeptide (TPR) repeat protein